MFDADDLLRFTLEIRYFIFQFYDFCSKFYNDSLVCVNLCLEFLIKHDDLIFFFYQFKGTVFPFA